MRISLKSRDAITPALLDKVKRAKNPQRALEAMGLAVVSLAKRNFTMPAARPAAWAPLKPATVKAKKRAGRSENPLQRTGTLAKSPRVTNVTRSKVTVGSDRKAGSHSLAAIHQLGAPKAKIPARPFFPFNGSTGSPTPKAAKLIKEAARASLELEK